MKRGWFTVHRKKKRKTRQSLFDQWFKSEFKWICLNEFHPETPQNTLQQMINLLKWVKICIFLSHKNHCYCWADRWSVLNRLQFIRRKEEHYTPYIWRTCLALFLQLQKLFSFYFFQWDSLSLSLSLSLFAVFLPHYCFGLCLKSTEILIWMPEVSILHIPLTTKVFFCISSVKGSKVSLHNEDNLKMVQF